MSFLPCTYCGAAYAPGDIGTVHRSDCLTLPQNKAKRANLLALYKVLKVNAPAREAINWDKFAEHAESVGLKYHPALGLMDMVDWNAVKEFVVG